MMHYRRAFLGRLRPSDRLAVTLLRGGKSPKATAAMLDAFSALRERAVEAGMSIFGHDALAVGPSEFVILGWLAVWQRSRVEPAIEQWRVPIREVQICAQLLDASGYRLDYHHIVHVQGVDSVNLVHPANIPLSEYSDLNPPGHNPLRHRILSELTTRGPLKMAELEQLGISRQTVSNLVKRGFVRRLRHGVYSLPERPDSEDRTSADSKRS